MDLNRQAWTSGTSLLLHPADVYVGLRSEKYFVERGQPLDIELIVTDIDGNPVERRPVTVVASRIQWKSQGGWHEEFIDPQTCQLSSKLDPLTCTLRYFHWRALPHHRHCHRRAGPAEREPHHALGQRRPASALPQCGKGRGHAHPDKDEYQPGDTAKILVQPPFTPAEILLTVSRSGILYTATASISKRALSRCPCRSTQGISPTSTPCRWTPLALWRAWTTRVILLRWHPPAPLMPAASLCLTSRPSPAPWRCKPPQMTRSNLVAGPPWTLK